MSLRLPVIGHKVHNGWPESTGMACSRTLINIPTTHVPTPACPNNNIYSVAKKNPPYPWMGDKTGWISKIFKLQAVLFESLSLISQQLMISFDASNPRSPQYLTAKRTSTCTWQDRFQCSDARSLVAQAGEIEFFLGRWRAAELPVGTCTTKSRVSAGKLTNLYSVGTIPFYTSINTGGGPNCVTLNLLDFAVAICISWSPFFSSCMMICTSICCVGWFKANPSRNRATRLQ